MIDLDALKAAGLNSEAHSALLLERHKCAARMDLLLDLVRKERAELARIDEDLSACRFTVAVGLGIIPIPWETEG